MLCTDAPRKREKIRDTGNFFDELTKDAAKQGFMIFMLDEDGKVSEEIAYDFSSSKGS
jgi:hypothetical protein